MGLDPIVRLRLTEIHQELQNDIRTWLDANLADEFRHSAANADYLPEDGHQRAVGFCQALHTKGWFVPHWPGEFEGGGLGTIEQMIIREQLAYAGSAAGELERHEHARADPVLRTAPTSRSSDTCPQSRVRDHVGTGSTQNPKPVPTWRHSA